MLDVFDKVLSEVPVMKTKLNELADIFPGYAPSTLRRYKNLKILGVKDLTDDWKIKLIKCRIPPRLKDRAVLPGDIVLASRGTVFKASITEDSVKCIPSFNVIVVRLHRAYRYLAPMLLQYFNDPVVSDRLKKENLSKLGKLCMSAKAIKKLTIHLPEESSTKDLKQLIESSESQYHQQLEAINKELEALNKKRENMWAKIRESLGDGKPESA